MTDPKPSEPYKNWQLRESGEDDQWRLLETEQNLPNHMQLQDEPGADIHEWQPVDYEDPEPGRGRNWILPTFIILALFGVVAYLSWLMLQGGTFDLGGLLQGPAAVSTPSDAQLAPEDTPPEAAAVQPPAGPITDTTSATATEAVTPAATTEPTPEAPPTPAASPTPAMLEQRIATVNSPAGLNLRDAPSAAGTLIQLLPNGTTAVVLNQQDDGWTQIQLTDGVAGWVSTEFITVATTMVPAAPSVTDGSPLTSTAPLTGVAPLTASVQLTTGVADVPDPFTAVIPPGESVVITITGGVNVREEPSATANVIILAPTGAALPYLQDSPDGAWVQVQLPNGQNGWMSADFVERRSTPAAPAAAAPAPVAGAAPLTGTAPLTATAGVTSTGAATGEPVQATINAIGVNLRDAPRADANTAAFVSGGVTLTVLGRSADGDWLRVRLDDGTEAWLSALNTELSAPIESLPVIP